MSIAERVGQDDLVTRLLYDLLGLGTGGLRTRMSIADEAAIFYGGLLGQNLRTAQGLQQILADYFQVKVTVEQFTGSWNRLPDCLESSRVAVRSALVHAHRLTHVCPPAGAWCLEQRQMIYLAVQVPQRLALTLHGCIWLVLESNMPG